VTVSLDRLFAVLKQHFGKPALAAVAVALFAWQFGMGEAGRLRNTVTALHSEIGQAEAVARARAATGNDVSPDGLDLASAAAPNPVPSLLSDLAQRHAVSISEASYTEVVRNGWHTVDVELRLRGSYGALRQVVGGLVAGQRGLVLQSFTVQREKAGDNAMNAEVKLTLYRSGQP
jgi:hypothetical protein